MVIECQSLIKFTAFMFTIRVMTECFNIFQRTVKYLILELKRTPLFFILFLRYLPNVSQWGKLGNGVEEISELRNWNFLKFNSKGGTRPPVRGTVGNSSGNNHAFPSDPHWSPLWCRWERQGPCLATAAFPTAEMPWWLWPHSELRSACGIVRV